MLFRISWWLHVGARLSLGKCPHQVARRVEGPSGSDCALRPPRKRIEDAVHHGRCRTDRTDAVFCALWIPHGPPLSTRATYARKRRTFLAASDRASLSALRSCHLDQFFVGFAGEIRARTFWIPTGTDLLAHWLTLRGEDVLWTIPVGLYIFIFYFQPCGCSHPLAVVLRTCFDFADPPCIFALASIAEFDLKFATVLPYFLGGALLSVMRLRSGNKWSDAPFAISLICLFLLYPRLWTSEPNIKVVQLAMWASPLYFIGILCVVALSILSPLSESVLGNRPMRFLGQISYSVYLLHMPVIIALHQFTEIRSSPLVFFIATFSITLIVSTLSFYTWERPSRRLIEQSHA